MVFVMAWRNIWRNRTRSMLVMLSVIIGLWAGLFTMGFVNGMYQEHFKDTIQNYLSNLQVHHKDFHIERELYNTISLEKSDINYLEKDKRIHGFSPRVITSVMLASPVNALGVNAIGIIPFREDSVTGLYKKIIEGVHLNTSKQNGILIGEKIASKLKVKIKNKVVISFQDMNGDIISAAYRVVGIFRSSNTSFDESNVFVLSDHIQSLSGLSPTSFHELAVLLNSNKDELFVKAELKKIFPKALVQDWMELSPELDLVMNSFTFYTYIFIGIILLALSFGIINTMLMAVLERVRELGMLMAIGMNKPRVFFMIVLETVFLSVAGSPIGFLVSYLTIYFFGKTGIDLSMFSKGLTGYGFATVIYPSLNVSIYFGISIMTFFAALLASLYPALKALKLKPVEAIRKI